MLLKRYKLTLEYDGALFSGWQKQKGVLTVQSLFEHEACRFVKHMVSTVCAGRTDAGVHAFGQVVHMDVAPKYHARALFYGLNDRLRGKGVSVVNVEEVSQEFHARFSAKWRRYVYKILTGTAPSALRTHRAWFVRTNLCLDSINQGLKALQGEHDFKAFQSSGCSAKTTVRTMREAFCEKHADEIHVTFEANAFLYHQVRNMIGVLVAVGSGRKSPSYVEEMLLAKCPKMRVRCAPPSGLYFQRVVYEI